MSAQSDSAAKRVSVRTLQKKKQAGEKIICLTAYDASFAHVLDTAGIDVVLVGDSLGMVMQGHDSTLPVTVDDILYHTQMVARGLQRALLMVDMPFLSFTSVAAAVEHAGRLMKQGGAHMVKLEGDAGQADIISALSRHGIPVCAHLGLQPQRVHKIGGYRVQGRDQQEADDMLRQALLLEQAGADVMLLECVPASLAAEITASVSIPVIGIGAGAACDGQILVLYDILGISVGRRPRFSKDFMLESGSIQGAIEAYAQAVRDGTFPGAEHVFS